MTKTYIRSLAALLLLWTPAALTAQQAESTEKADDQQKDEVFELPAFSVKSARDKSYLASETTSGTRMATAIVDLPYSVQVMSRDFMDDFRLYDLDEIAQYVSNMSPGDKYIGGGGGTRVRGFPAVVFRNGFYRAQSPEGVTIERVEFVKGPASAIYGRTSPGGIVNFISKKPSSIAKQELVLTHGTYDTDSVTASSTGPLFSKKLLYRVDGSYSFERRATDFWYKRNRNLAASLQYRLSSNTALTLEYEFITREMNDFYNPTRYLEPETDSTTTQTLIRRGFAYYMPEDKYGDLGKRIAQFSQAGPNRNTLRKNGSWYGTLEHKINDVFNFRANANYTSRWFQQYTPSTIEWNLSPTTISSATALARYGSFSSGLPGYWNSDRSMVRRTTSYETMGSQVDLTASYSFLGMKHRTLWTADFLEDDMKAKQWQLSSTALVNYMTAQGYSDSDIWFWMRPNPYMMDRYRALKDPVFNPNVFPMTDASTYNLYNTLFGSLVSHTTEMLKGRLVLTGSARQDWVKIHRQQPLSTDPDLFDANEKNNVFTYAAGVNYHIVPSQVVAFYNISKSFNPTPQVDPNTGSILGFTTARGVEAGIKGAVLDQRIGYTLSVFRATQDNEVTDNPAWAAENDPAKALLLPRYVGGARSKTRGLGLDINANVTKRLSLGGSLSWTDARVADNKAAPSLIGTRLTGNSGFPVRSASVNSSYSLPAIFGIKGLSVGASYLYQVAYLRTVTATTSSTISEPLWVPSKNEINARVTWQQPPLKKGSKLRLSYTLNVNNVFDRMEATTAGFYPNGREVLFTAKIQY